MPSTLHPIEKDGIFEMSQDFGQTNKTLLQCPFTFVVTSNRNAFPQVLFLGCGVKIEKEKK